MVSGRLHLRMTWLSTKTKKIQWNSRGGQGDEDPRSNNHRLFEMAQEYWIHNKEGFLVESGSCEGWEIYVQAHLL